MGFQTGNREEVLAEKFGGYEGRVIYHPISDIGATIASGSYLVEGMIIMPCSMGTLSSVAHGSSDNLMGRAADVMMKEGRPLVLVPRDASACDSPGEHAGAGQAWRQNHSAMPAFYYGPKTIDDIVNFLVGKVLDSLRIDHRLYTRWGE